jgi:cobalt-zinc-cadmium efflux system membrane fusion protein
VEVLSGLKAGEQIVVEGAFLLKAEVEKSSGGGDEHGH